MSCQIWHSLLELLNLQAKATMFLTEIKITADFSQEEAITFAYVLDTMNIEYKILSNTEADIFEKVNISKLTTELSKKDCEVISIHEHDESLESYFVSLVGGARHE